MTHQPPAHHQPSSFCVCWLWDQICIQALIFKGWTNRQWHTNPLPTNNDTSTPCPQTMTHQPPAHKQWHINPCPQWHINPLPTNNDTSTPCPQTMTHQPPAHKQWHINPCPQWYTNPLPTNNDTSTPCPSSALQLLCLLALGSNMHPCPHLKRLNKYTQYLLSTIIVLRKPIGAMIIQCDTITLNTHKHTCTVRHATSIHSNVWHAQSGQWMTVNEAVHQALLSLHLVNCIILLLKKKRGGFKNTNRVAGF